VPVSGSSILALFDALNVWKVGMWKLVNSISLV
jgi:hypothetical protein